MTSELRKFIYLVFELILLGGIVALVVLSASVGKASVGNYVEHYDSKNRLPDVVAYSKGSVSYYELVDLIDYYAPTTDVTLTYKDTTGHKSTVTYTNSLDGKTVKLVLGDTLPQKGVPFNGLVYSRLGGVLYRTSNGVTSVSNTYDLENDMKLPQNSLKFLSSLHGDGVLDYSFTEALFAWSKDIRYVCTLSQTYDTQTINKITLQSQN